MLVVSDWNSESTHGLLQVSWKNAAEGNMLWLRSFPWLNVEVHRVGLVGTNDLSKGTVKSVYVTSWGSYFAFPQYDDIFCPMKVYKHERLWPMGFAETLVVYHLQLERTY